MTDLSKVLCHYGVVLPSNGGPCPECGADSSGVCGKLYEAGQKDARAEYAVERDELIAALRKARVTLATALRYNAPFDPAVHVAEHETIKAIDAALAKVDAP